MEAIINLVTNAVFEANGAHLRTVGDAVQAEITEEFAELWVSLPTFADLSVGERIHLSFLLTPAPDAGYGYALLQIHDETGDEIDSAFPTDRWSRVHLESTLTERNGNRFAYIALQNAASGIVQLRDFCADRDLIDNGHLLGGATLTQFEIDSGLMMGYAMQSPEGHLLMIDGGKPQNAEMLCDFIKESGAVVDGWFLTHYHADHIDALTSVLNTRPDIHIKHLYFDFPTDSKHLETYGDSENHCIDDLKRAIAHSTCVENVITPKKGDCFSFGSLKIKVLNDADLTGTDDFCNNSTVVYKAVTPGESVLFFGDLASHGSELIKDPDFLREMRTCTIVQMAHHGQDGVGDDVYRAFDRIRICLYPAAKWLYDVDAGVGIYGKDIYETLKTRALMRELGVLRSYPAKSGRVILK